MDKKQVRAVVRESKKQINTKVRAKYSKIICEKVYNELKDVSPTNVALFLSMADEVDTIYLIRLLQEQGKHTILVPKVEDNTTINFYKLGNIEEYALSGFGIKEPSADISKAKVPQLMIVPGVAFDTVGGRVGRGKGYYDRYFARYSELIRQKIAIAYQLQVFDEDLPMDTNDYYMDMLVTEEQCYTF